MDANFKILFTSGCWLERCDNGVCGKYLPSKDIIIIRQNNVSLCRPLSSSMETASSTFSQGSISWTAGVTVVHPVALSISVLQYKL